jgi:hypothetical protein
MLPPIARRRAAAFGWLGEWGGLQFIRVRFVQIERLAKFRLAASQLVGLRNNRRQRIPGFARLPNVLGSEIAFAASRTLGILEELRHAVVHALQCSPQVIVHHARHLPLFELLEFSVAAGVFYEKPECASLEMRSRCGGSAAPIVWMRASSVSSIDRLAEVLASRSENMRIEGHTDNVPIHNPHFPSNRELSTSRHRTREVFYFQV